MWRRPSECSSYYCWDPGCQGKAGCHRRPGLKFAPSPQPPNLDLTLPCPPCASTGAFLLLSFWYANVLPERQFHENALLLTQAWVALINPANYFADKKNRSSGPAASLRSGHHGHNWKPSSRNLSRRELSVPHPPWMRAPKVRQNQRGNSGSPHLKLDLLIYIPQLTMISLCSSRFFKKLENSRKEASVKREE